MSWIIMALVVVGVVAVRGLLEGQKAPLDVWRQVASSRGGEDMNRASSDGRSRRTCGHGRGRARRPSMAILAVVLGWALAQPGVASAQDDRRSIDATVWGLTTLELTAGVSMTAMVLWDPEATQ